ncbi:hypothetical protein M9Y10_038762 [Tritrichomonas musculus]|uniref:Flavodoxin-like domain-containing protein n=1 Tax=Tritrichomonas musculus TaxID=1915356 RepID=A0ABR2K9A7_9EUKA
MSKDTLVAYFSVTGKTSKIATLLASLVNADVFEIKPVKPYEKDDLNWQDKSSRTSKEHDDPSFRPEIAKKIENFDHYKKIFIGFPIWWYTAPRIINTFLDSYDFSNKTIITFATSGGTEIEKADNDLCEACKNHGRWVKGKRFNEIEMDVINVMSWVDSLGL